MNAATLEALAVFLTTAIVVAITVAGIIQLAIRRAR